MLGWRVRRLLKAKGGPCCSNPRGKTVIGVDSDNPGVPRVDDSAAPAAVVGVDSMGEVVVAAEVREHHCHWSRDRMRL